MLKELFPNMLKLCQLLSIFPISVACVERLFSRMKLQKTQLHNRMLDCTLDHLLFIGMELKKGFDDDDLERIVDLLV